MITKVIGPTHKKISLVVSSFDLSCLVQAMDDYPKVNTASEAMTIATAQEVVDKLAKVFNDTNCTCNLRNSRRKQHLASCPLASR